MTDASPKHYWDVPFTLPTGAWAEKRRLASALRELTAIVVTTDAPEEELARASLVAEDLVRELGAFPGRTFKQAYSSCRSKVDLAVFADRTALTGLSNPVSPGMMLEREGDVAVGRVTFGPAFEGVPGCVHGGFVATAFDQVFGYLQVLRGIGGLTATLEVRYLRPTPLETELRVEASSLEDQGRKSLVVAKMLADGIVTAEATATFVRIDAARMRAILGASAPEKG